MMIPKPKVAALLKSKSAPSNASALLKQKKAQAAALKGGATPPAGAPPAQAAAPAHPAAPPAAHPPPGAPPHGAHPAAGAPGAEGGDDQQMFITELLEEAAQEAEAGSDQALEDAVAGYSDDFKPGDIPEWVQDKDKWNEAAQAVGLGTPEADDAYQEPFVVAAYLYKKLGGGVHGMEADDAGGDGAAPDDKKPADGKDPSAGAKPAAKPGSVAAKLHGANAVMSDAAKAKAPDAKVAPKAGPAGAAGGAAGAGGAPAPTAGADDGGGDLKQMLDAAAQEAQSSPDPEIQQAMQSEPPQEGAPPSWAADADKWTKAEAAVKPHWTEYPDPFIVVATLYKKMGGTVGAAGAAPAPAPAAGAM